MNIKSLRDRIDALDEELLQLLNKRSSLVLELALVKRNERLPLHDPDRERGIITRVCNLNQGPLDRPAVETVFNTIIGESRRIARTIVD